MTRNVTQRRQYVAEHDLGFSGDQYKDRRRRVIGDVAEALERAINNGPAPRFEPNTHDDIREVSTTSAEPEVAEPAPQGDSRARLGRRPIVAGIATVVLVLAVVAVVVALTRDSGADTRWNGMTASELEQRYDGKDPRGHDGDQSHCADPPASQMVDSSSPPVMGPERNQVGTVQLRKSAVCPTRDLGPSPMEWQRAVDVPDPARMDTACGHAPA